MNIKIPSTALIFLCSIIFAVSTNADGPKKPEDFVQLAFIAGSGTQCGLSIEESNEALKKINFILNCKVNNGIISKASLNSYLISAEYQFKKGRDNPPHYPPEMCKSLIYMVRSLNKITAC